MIARLICWVMRSHRFGRPYPIMSLSPGAWKEKRCRRCGHREVVRTRRRAPKDPAP